MTARVVVRAACADDETAWRRLWAGYNAFYEADVAAAVTARTWARILDPAAPLLGRVAACEDKVVGFSISVLHEGTWVETPICYLEDLFVDPDHRGRGIGRALIADLIALCGEHGWSRLYWHTRADNPARRLYDEFVKADGFVRYILRP